MGEGVHIIVTMRDVGGLEGTVTSHTSQLWQVVAKESDIIVAGGTPGIFCR